MSTPSHLKEAWKALREFYPGLSPDAEVWARQRKAGQAANDDQEPPETDVEDGSEETGNGRTEASATNGTEDDATNGTEDDAANGAEDDAANGEKDDEVVELVVQDSVLHPGWRHYAIRSSATESEVLDERAISVGDEDGTPDWNSAGYTRLPLELEPMDLVECLANHLVAASRMPPSSRLADLMDRILILTELATAALEDGSLAEGFPEENDAREWLAGVQDQVDRLAERH